MLYLAEWLRVVPVARCAEWWKQSRIPVDLVWEKLPDSLHARLHHLLDKQDVGEGLTPEEQREAAALVELSEFISLLNLRVRRVARQS